MINQDQLVSIIIPTYNRAQDVNRALQSVINQTHINWEVIVIDNNSTDDTNNVILSFQDPRIRIFKIFNYGVIAASRNMGIEKASGEFIAFLDSDDWWTSHKLEESLKYLNQGSDLVYHDLWVVEKEDKKKHTKTVGVRDLTSPIFDDLILHGSAIPNSSVVVRKKLLREIKGLSEDINLIAAEDYDCWLRISLITDRFACVPGVLGFYWQGLTNNSNPERKSINLIKLQELYFDPFIRKHKIEIPIWFLYEHLRSAYLLGDFNKAIIHIKLMNSRSLSWNLKLKLLFMQMRIKSSRGAF